MERVSVWQNHAQQWGRVGSPLRPNAEDGTLLRQVISSHAPLAAAPRVVVLGVTPEMAALGWPPTTDLLAVDKNRHMIEAVWPGFPNPGEGVLQADWLQLPLPDNSRDFVISDGCFGVLRYPDQYRTLVRHLQRVLQAGGLFAFRVFVRSEDPETPEEVYAAAMNGKIANFHAFKLRLLMAMQPNTAAGVRTGDVWDAWAVQGPTPADLAARSGWPLEQINTIDAYRGQNDVYHFPTLRELRALLADEAFEEAACLWPAYELGERCPTLGFTPRP